MGQFSDNLEFNYAKTMKKEVVALFDGAKSVVIDLKNVERASLSCIQILVAAKRKADKDGVQIAIHASEALEAMLEDLGLSQILESERVFQ